MVSNPAAAQTWTGNTSTDWTVGSNWGGTVPTTGAVTINTTSPNPAVLGVAGAATGTSGNLSVGSSGTGSLTIQNGSTLTTSGTGFSYIGANGSTGTMTVTGAGSAWVLNGSPAAVSVIFGQTETASSGTLNISDGGAVRTAGDFAGGNVTLNVTGGGTLVTGRDAYLGRLVGANATATISGAGSQWTIASRLMVGNGGTGALTVSNSATVDVATSTTVGDSAGQGTLTITTGGVLQTPTLIRGTGPVQVTFDSGTLRAKANSATFVTGFTGTQLNIAAGGLTIDTAGFDVTSTAPFSGAGALTKTGVGALTLSGAQPYTGATTVGAGRLALSNVTGFVSATTVNPGTTLSFTGTTSVTAAAPITLNDGATLENSNPSSFVVLTGAVTSSGNTSINSNQVAGTGRGLYLDGGLKGSGTVTINTVNAGTSVALRNNNSTFAGTLVVNGIANAAAGAGSGLALGGAATSNALLNADVVLNGTIELADRGFGSGFSTSIFNMGALSGSGIIVGNRQTNGNFGTTLILGNTNGSGLFSGRILRGSGVTNVVGITKVGTGTQIFSGANGYTGATNVMSGSSTSGTTARWARPLPGPLWHRGPPCRWKAALPSGPRR